MEADDHKYEMMNKIDNDDIKSENSSRSSKSSDNRNKNEDGKEYDLKAQFE